jgi:KDO2-lipid IV(A) lauroyltransferase
MREVFRIFHFVSYLAFRACEGAVRMLPLDWAFLLGRAAGEVGYRCFGRRRRLALSNLRLAFGNERSEDELHALNREHFQLLGANLLAGLKCSALPQEKIWERVTAEVPEDRLQTGWIALISHIGNWELFSHLGEKYPEYRFGAVYQGLANPYIDSYLTRTRTRSGTALFDRRRDLLRCVRFLREGGVVGVLVDQGAGYAGLWTPLFNRLTSSSTLAATLAVRTGLPVVPLSIYTSGRARWKLVISDPVFPGEDESEALTARINALLEEQIRRSPADWLWSHNRWKPLRPHFLFKRNQRRVFLPSGVEATALDPFRILIVAPQDRDAAQAALPVIRAISEGRPDNWLAVLAPAATGNIWRNEAAIRLVFELAEGRSIVAHAAQIRQTARFDAAIFFDQDWKTALAARMAGIPIRVGHKRGWFSFLYNQHPAESGTASNAAESHLQIARCVGADTNIAT